MEQLNPNAIKRMQTGVEPDTTRASSPLEAIQALRKKEMEQTAAAQPPAQPPREYISVDGFRVPKDFFTCLTMCIIKLDDPGVNNILTSFGFAMKDADGKIIFPQPVVASPKKTKKRK